jgi:hypothetical protein
MKDKADYKRLVHEKNQRDKDYKILVHEKNQRDKLYPHCRDLTVTKIS